MDEFARMFVEYVAILSAPTLAPLLVSLVVALIVAAVAVVLILPVVSHWSVFTSRVAEPITPRQGRSQTPPVKARAPSIAALLARP